MIVGQINPLPGLRAEMTSSRMPLESCYDSARINDDMIPSLRILRISTDTRLVVVSFRIPQPSTKCCRLR
jgi:hypothetical protein